MNIWVASVFLISCSFDALGFWGGLRPGSVIFVWGFCGVGVSMGAVHDLVLFNVRIFFKLLFCPPREPPVCSKKLAAGRHR